MAVPELEFDSARILGETVIRRVEIHHELPSTSDLALELAANVPTADLPLLVVAARQTGGRGRGENRWWANDGALTFSVVLDTIAWELPQRIWPRISLAIGIAAAQSVQAQLGPLPRSLGAARLDGVGRRDVRAKWPNDVFVDGRKICGILAENVGPHPHRLVVGVGLNVNNSWREAPTELQAVGTSLVDLADRQFSLETILVDLLQRVHQTLGDVADDTYPLTECWREWCMLEGRTVTVEAGPRRTTGVCHGIDENGALLLHTESGIERCVAGTIAKIH